MLQAGECRGLTAAILDGCVGEWVRVGCARWLCIKGGVTGYDRLYKRTTKHDDQNHKNEVRLSEKKKKKKKKTTIVVVNDNENHKRVRSSEKNRTKNTPQNNDCRHERQNRLGKDVRSS
jgi:hypothetical protein